MEVVDKVELPNFYLILLFFINENYLFTWESSININKVYVVAALHKLKIGD